jgi:hypothetical protein
MSLSKDNHVSKLVEKYRRMFPNVERPLLRKLIREENKITNPSELKKLDRYLKKAYSSNALPMVKPQKKIQPHGKPRLSWNPLKRWRQIQQWNERIMREEEERRRQEAEEIVYF